MLLIGWFISCCLRQGASHGPLLNVLLDGERGEENTFSRSNSLGYQQNKPMDARFLPRSSAPVPAT